MLIIRSEQLAAFAPAARRGTVERVARFLRERGGPCLRDAQDADVLRHAGAVLATAAGVGIAHPRDIEDLAMLCLDYGWAFIEAPEHGWMKAILTDARIDSPTERLRRLVDEIRYRRQEHEHASSLIGTFFPEEGAQT